VLIVDEVYLRLENWVGKSFVFDGQLHFILLADSLLHFLVTNLRKIQSLFG